MNHAIKVTVFLAFAALGVLGQSPSSLREADLREIERLEVEWNTINEISDAQGKERLLTDDSYHVGPSGRLYTRAQDVDAMRSSREQKEASNSSLRFAIYNRRIRLFKDVAVVTATGTSYTTRDGLERQGGSFRVIHVWEKRDGNWLLSVDQVTALNLPSPNKKQ